MSTTRPPAAREARSWPSVAAEMAEGIKAAFVRFPVTAVLLVLLALFSNLLIADLDPDRVQLDDMILPLIAAALAALAGTLGCEARDMALAPRRAVELAGAILGFSLGYWGGATQHSLLMPALFGMIPLAPYLARGSPGAFWLFGVRLAFCVLLAGLSLLLFAGGISAIFASLTYLFGIDIPGRAYEHVWAWTGLLAAPLFGLGQLPRDFSATAETDMGRPADRGMRALGDFIAAPLLLIYAAILHAYAVKILLTGQVPRGQIGWLVLGFGICVIGSLIVIHPFMHAVRAPTRLFLRLWPFLLPVPLLLLVHAAWLRIDQHALTPDRYLLVLFAIVMALLAGLQLVPRLRQDVRILAGLPVLALLLASFGPQGAISQSTRSQAARLIMLAKEQPLEGQRHEEALSALRFLARHDALGLVVPDGFDTSGAPDHSGEELRRIAASYGIDPDLQIGLDSRFSRSYGRGGAVSVGEFDLLVPTIAIVESAAGPESPQPVSGLDLSFALENGTLVVSRDALEVRFALPREQLVRIASNTRPEGPPDRHAQPHAEPIRLDSGGRAIMLVPSYLHGSLQPEPLLRNFSGAVLLRERDWR